ncbi:GNAT family N-acetyltransferase [Methyloligella solikamskensis]|uniref:GNAT family N-acetyltransferase n=1 Tax=Methyloligella solikamskensis TaxID=1177756 RepID=A0ABW3J889_9HYPH
MTSLVQAKNPRISPRRIAQRSRSGLVSLDQVSLPRWEHLAESAADPNGFSDPAFLLPVCRHMLSPGACKVLQNHSPDGALAGLIPFRTAYHALKLPIPAAIGLFPYVTLGTPLLAGDDIEKTVAGLIDAAADQGIAAIGLPMVALDGPAAQAIEKVLSERGLQAQAINVHERAALEVPEDPESYLRDGLGSKKLKELRRQNNRLGDMGPADWTVSRSEPEILAALGRFLTLEANGWKGEKGSSLAQDQADRAFVTDAARNLAARRAIEIVELTSNGNAIASGIVIRSGRSALYFKTAYNEAFSRYSPGVQLTVFLTRHLSEQGEVDYVDSTAAPGHPMIDHVWRERRRVGDMLIPTRKGALPQLCIAAIKSRAALRARVKTAYLKFVDGGLITPRKRKKTT